jgi:G3E family GTPase
VIILNKMSLVTEEELKLLRGVVTRLNPKAEIIETDYSKVSLDRILNTNKFSMDDAKYHPGWLEELRGSHIPETIEYGVTSFVMRARRPFHPGRLHKLVQGFKDGKGSKLAEQVIRSKGSCWLASRNQHMIYWGHAGRQFNLKKGDRWYASMPGRCNHAHFCQLVLNHAHFCQLLLAFAFQTLAHSFIPFFSSMPFLVHMWPNDKTTLSIIKTQWDPEAGDCAQEIVVIGQKMDHTAVKAELDACLLTDKEMKLEPEEWTKQFADPFFSGPDALAEWPLSDDEDVPLDYEDDMHEVGMNGDACTLQNGDDDSEMQA